MENNKTRMIQEYVPGKQVTLAHIIARPGEDVYKDLGLEKQKKALGLMTITPSEAAIIAGDAAVKVADVEIGFLDRFSGSLVVIGNVSSVETAIRQAVLVLEKTLGFSSTEITHS